ncbi:MAG TPA: hypothetical protein VI670_12970 [Thermoanaerobaculia bacterium]|jgi:hypothetical protein
MPASSKSDAGRRVSPDRGDGLFDFPLPIPTNTVYESLGIGPESSQDDVAWAIKETSDRLKSEELQLKAQLKPAFAKVPDLEPAYDELTRLSADPQASADGLSRLQATISKLEKLVLAAEPRFYELRRKSEDARRKLDELNALKLDQPVHRKTYDEDHPPIALLKVSAAERDAFMDEPRVLLALLRRDMTAFLQQRGEAVVHASDLDRDDFTADFTHTPLLDGSD